MQCFDLKFLRFCLFYNQIETSQTVLCHTAKWVNGRRGEKRKEEEEERRNSINTILLYINKTNKNKNRVVKK